LRSACVKNMAVLGIQFVITMMMATVLSRVGPHLSLARWLLTSRFSALVRYLHPSDEELRQFASAPVRDKREKKKARLAEKNGHMVNNGTFNVARNIDIQLDKVPVSVGDLVQLRYYSEYQWLLDFAAYSLVTYILSEIYIFMLPAKASQEVNLSLVWLILVLGFAFKLLLSLTGQYFEGEEGGERSLVLVMGCAYLLIAMLILVVDESTLETGLDEAYRSFNASAAAFLESNAGLDSSGPASKLVTKFFIALWCGLIGALFTFPGLRVARMHWDSLKYGESSVRAVLLHIGFILPLILTTFWVRPLTRDPLTVKIYRNMSTPLMTEDEFESLRLYLIMFTVLYRLFIMPTYLQGYLNLAYHKMSELKQEAGKISNIDLQRLVIRVFYYLCVVTLQYVAPMIMILYLSLLYKTLGGGSWNGQLAPTTEGQCSVDQCPIDQPRQVVEDAGSNPEIGIGEILNSEETVGAIRDQFSLAWSSFKHIFTPQVFKGLIGFSTWWCCFAWFGSSAIGIGYQTYFSNS